VAVKERKTMTEHEEILASLTVITATLGSLEDIRDALDPLDRDRLAAGFAMALTRRPEYLPLQEPTSIAGTAYALADALIAKSKEKP
jgi:hypothetical protein